MTWSKSSDQVKFYVNGSTSSCATGTGLGTWAGSLSSSGTVIGSSNLTPTTPWIGNLAHVAVWNTPLTATQVTSLKTALNLTATRDIATTYSGSGSVKIVSTDAGAYVQPVNVGNTNTHVLEAYVYTNGTAVTSSDLELWHNGSTVSTTYTRMGSTWWYKLSGTVTGVNGSSNYGVYVKAGKTVYVDNLSLTEGYYSSGTLVSSIFDAESHTGWGSVTFSTDGTQTSNVKVRTSNSADMSGATDFGSCPVVSSGTDVSSNGCVSDNHRYIQYQISLSTSSILQTPTFQDLSISFTAGSHTANTYYVDATGGSDSNTGTSIGAPWQTINNVNIAMDSGVIQAGDTIYFKRGETFTGSLDVDVSGSSGNVITFGAYGSGNKPIFNATGNASAVDLTGRSYIRIENLNLKNATTQAVYLYNGGVGITASGVDADNSTSGFRISTGTFTSINIISSTITTFTYGINVGSTTSVSDLTIDGVTASGGTNGVLMADSGTYSGVTISNSTFSSNSGIGVSITGTHTNLTLRSVVANSNSSDGVLVHSGTGTISTLIVSDSTFNQNVGTGLIMRGTGSPATITNTEASSNQWDGFSLKNNWTNVTYDDVTANSNGVDGVGGDGDGFTAHDDCQATIKNSVARNNKQGNVSFVDNAEGDIYYNEFTLTTASTHGSVWDGGAGDFRIYNNVIYNSSQNGYGIEIDRLNAKTVTIKNNIVYGFQYGIFQDTPYASTVVEDYNIVYNFGTLARTGFTGGSNTLNSNPLFINASNNDFSLQSTSPAIDRGVSVGLTRDHIGTDVPKGVAPDIGARERDVDRPTISLVAFTLTASGVTVTWQTNESTSSKVEYGPNNTYGTVTTERDTSPRVTSHSVTLTGLNSCTPYHYRVKSSDATGYEALSQDYSFVTSGCPPIGVPAPVCTDAKPGAKAPWLYGATTKDEDSIILYFTKADDPVNKYAVEYGTEPGNYQWGVHDVSMQSEDRMTFLVGSLSPNTRYYFRVRGGNGCATGLWSNEISAETRSGVSYGELEITDTELKAGPSEVRGLLEDCRKHVVTAGDSLWSISKKLLGDGNRYGEIIEKNKKTYPSLEAARKLEIGWELVTGCSTGEGSDVKSLDGYSVKVRVLGATGQPVERAKVMIHSEVRLAYTGPDGVAEFENVEPGSHRVVIAYDNFEGEQSVYLDGDVKKLDLNITVQPRTVNVPTWMYFIVGVVGLMVITLTVFVARNSKVKVRT